MCPPPQVIMSYCCTQDWHTKTPLQRMCVLAAIRPDRLPAALTLWVKDVLGEYTAPSAPGYDKLWQPSQARQALSRVFAVLAGACRLHEWGCFRTDATGLRCTHPSTTLAVSWHKSCGSHRACRCRGTCSCMFSSRLGQLCARRACPITRGCVAASDCTGSSIAGTRANVCGGTSRGHCAAQGVVAAAAECSLGTQVAASTVAAPFLVAGAPSAQRLPPLPRRRDATRGHAAVPTGSAPHVHMHRT